MAFNQTTDQKQQAGRSNGDSVGKESFQVSAPSISLPKGGGAIRGIGEKFAANPVTGTGSITVPIATSPGRSGFGPQLSLSYDSGSGNGPFGFGWSLSFPSITRKTDKGLPKYQDCEESDVFILSGSEDLVPVLIEDCGEWRRDAFERTVDGLSYHIQRYRPRVEGLFARIERWTNLQTGEIHWRSISRDNVTTWYGKTPESRIADPDNGIHIFSWLICESYDDKGNAIVYEYKAENSEHIDTRQVHERNRTDSSRSANRYIKRIRYGNKKSRLIEPDLSKTGWLFDVIFDYGDGHYEDLPLDPAKTPDEQHKFAQATLASTKEWPVREDAISSFRATFEVRTYRLCQRVLIFHHFPDELGTEDYLVRSTEFTYRQSPIASFIRSVTQSGYTRQSDGKYLKKSLPPLEFKYTEAVVHDEIREVDAESLENLPYGMDESTYQWVDLDGEGLPGILTEQGTTWFYKRNLSPINLTNGNGSGRIEARFGPIERIGDIPNTSISAGGAQFMDLAGDGQPDLVEMRGPVKGFYERTEDQGWVSFRPFLSWPNVDPSDPNLRFVDLDGDGHADILITSDKVLTWHSSLAEEGYGPAHHVYKALDEEKGPRLVFSDGTQSIYLADMSGDGLTDLVRIRNGEVCYWPNLGYGRFGCKVTMDNSPWFDQPNLFDQQRMRVADVDGSGNIDIIYLHTDGVKLYFNRSGNSWSMPRTLDQFPRAENLSSVTTVDLLGNGTACLVWSSPLPGNARQPMRYIDLMGGQKPHLLVKTVNNLGAETHVQYAPSTKFYLADKRDGKPWITRLPFPVHVVEKVESFDRLSRNRFVTRYCYHHGFFDGVEREFRGFGMVEQRDSELLAALTEEGELPRDNLDAASFVPPVLTKTWFHTGVYLGRDRVSAYYAGLSNDQDPGEYYREPGFSHAEARWTLLEDTVLPLDLTTEEEREACRALKGSMLRQEVYAEDGTDKAQHPYTVTEQNFTIRRLQPQGQNRHAVFLTHASESIVYRFERNPADPRTSHALTLELDDFGNVLREAAVAYGRRQEDPTLPPEERVEQSRAFITYSENRVTNVFESDDDYRVPLAAEAITFELTGPVLSAGEQRFSVSEMLTAGAAAAAIPYEQDPSPGLLQKRPIEQVRTLYRPDDLGASLNDASALLPLGTLERLALPGESYKIAFTPGLLAGVYGARVDDAMLQGEGRYVHSEGDANWWIPTGRIFLSPESTDSAAQELSYARQHFFLTHRSRDPFHSNKLSTESFVFYDDYDLLLLESRDALGNRVTAGERDAAGNLVASGNDYRVLQPRLMMDQNRNRSAAAYDALGIVVGTAVSGKPEENLGDDLHGFQAELDGAVILDHLAYPLADPLALLGRASSRLIYDLFAYQRTKDQPEPQPAVVYTMVREIHHADSGGAQTGVQHSFSYSDGFGREIQRKIQAEPGPAPLRDPSGKIIVGADGQAELSPNDVNPRWVGSGWTVFNNKRKPVRRYEPFFTDTQRFEFDVRIGVSSVLCYDPMDRVVATLHPDHTWEKVVFDPWRLETWDASDTVLVADQKSDPDAGGFFLLLPKAEYLPTWYARRQGSALGPLEEAAAQKAAIHTNTPTISHLDSLGRPFLSVLHNRFKYSNSPVNDPPQEEFYRTRVLFDIEGNQREVVDARGRGAIRYDCDMVGKRIHQASMEAGERWMLGDVAGNALYVWDSRDHRFRSAYDAMRRPTDFFLSEGGAPELLVGHSVYGETLPDPEVRNLRGRVFEAFDQAGITLNDAYDFKGNLLTSRRQLAQEYKETIDWATAAVPLESGSFESRTSFDALNRPTQMITPDASVIRPGYNQANLLERLEVNLRGALVATPFVTNIDYDAKGQRTTIDYGNGVRTSYQYDPLTFRLVKLVMRRDAAAFPDDCPQPPPAGWPGCQLQNLSYTFDPVGNITNIRDDAQQTVFFRNKRVEPSAAYSYDALYRLIEATGREHLGQAGSYPAPSSYNDKPRVGIQFSASDGNAMARYLQRYLYDAVGNIQRIEHRGSDPANPGWTRSYDYLEPSLLEAGQDNNRLTRTLVGADTESYSVGGNGYDPHGNMRHMPQLQIMQWDFRDQLQMTQRQAVNAQDDDGVQRQGERTWYVYDSGGHRVRKVTELPIGQLKDERLYLGGFEIYRRHGAQPLTRETLHILDDKERVALVETRTQGEDPSPSQLIRYQYSNHQGSASLELDQSARIISYEEYTPYGSTSYQAVRSLTEGPKRYRYTGKERDEESGLTYHGARYCVSWLGRWISADPMLAQAPQLTPYGYAAANPVRYTDLTGRQPEITGGQNTVLRLIDAWRHDVDVFMKGHNIGEVIIQHAEAEQRVADRIEWVAREMGQPVDSPYVVNSHSVKPLRAEAQRLEAVIDEYGALAGRGERLQGLLAKSGLPLENLPRGDNWRYTYSRKLASGMDVLADPFRPQGGGGPPPPPAPPRGGGGGGGEPPPGGGGGGEVRGGEGEPRALGGAKGGDVAAVEDAVVLESRAIRYGAKALKVAKFGGKVLLVVGAAITVASVAYHLSEGNYKAAAFDVADFFTFGGASYAAGVVEDVQAGIEAWKNSPEAQKYAAKAINSLTGVQQMNDELGRMYQELDRQAATRRR